MAKPNKQKSKPSNIRIRTEQKYHLTSDQVKDAMLCYIEKHATEMIVFVGEGDVAFDQELDSDDGVSACIITLTKMEK